MSDTWGALAQDVPAATTLTDVYEVPADQRGTVQVVACNRGSTAVIRLSHAISGAADSDEQYLLFDLSLAGGETRVTSKFIVGAGDILRAYSDTGDVAFNINGIIEE